MPIDITNKEEKKIALTGAEIESALLKANDIQSSASEINENSINKYRGLRNSNIVSFLGKSISILGDSLTFGANATKYNGYAQKIRDLINSLNSVDNFGLTGIDRGFDPTGQTKVLNENATDSLCGAYYLLTAGATLDFYNSSNYQIVIANKEIKVLALLEDSGKSITVSEYNSSNVLISTNTLTIGTDGLTESFTSSPNTVKLVLNNISGSTLKVEGYYLVEDSNYHTVNIMAKGGRELELIEDQVIDRWFDGSEYAIMALGTNDSNLTTFTNRIDYIISKYNAQTYTKLIIIYMDSADTTVLEELTRLSNSCNGSIFIDFRSILTANNTLSDRDDLVDLGLVDTDRLHFTDLGHEYLASIVLNAMGYDSILNSNKLFNILSNSVNKYDNLIYIDQIKRNVKTGDTDNLESITTGEDNSAFGDRVLERLTTGSNNSGFGSGSLRSIVSGGANTTNGSQALRSLTGGDKNTAIGAFALAFYTNGANATSLTNSTGIGCLSKVSGDNQVQLGDSTTTTYAYGAVQDRSDIRDKADIEVTPLGLDFICKVNPVQYRWDYRDDYISIDKETGKATTLEKDGSKKRSRLHQGVIAQQVKEVIDELGVDFGGYQDHSLSGGCDVKSIGYQEFIPPLIKAIQELKAEIEILKSKA